MLTIRLQRVGRKGYPVYRVAVMEAHRHPLAGRVVAYVGSYNPHTKEYKLNKELIEKYLSNGAQPTPRVVKLLIEEKIKLPHWVVKHSGDKKSKIRFEDKLRKNRPAEETKAEATEPSDEVVEESPKEEVNEETETPVPAEEQATAEADEKIEEKPTE